MVNLWFQYVNYQEGIRVALEGSVGADHASILTYARAWDFAVVKTSGLFVSFVLVFTGALYVLRAGERNGPRELDSAVSEIFVGFQAAKSR